MIEINGDLFSRHIVERSSDGYDELIYPDAICITTNGFVKGNGRAVMGRGCAKGLCRVMPDSDKALGDKILSNGHVVQFILGKVISFPVKPFNDVMKIDKYGESNVVSHMEGRFKVGDTVPGWACKASVSLIRDSAKELVRLVRENNFKSVTLPRPGCGAGELEWEDVKSVLEGILDDRFYVITW